MPRMEIARATDGGHWDAAGTHLGPQGGEVECRVLHRQVRHTAHIHLGPAAASEVVSDAGALQQLQGTRGGAATTPHGQPAPEVLHAAVDDGGVAQGEKAPGPKVLDTHAEHTWQQEGVA